MSDLLAHLAEETGLNVYDVRRIMLSAPVRYKTYPVEKKSGGYRIIAQPAREVKAVQRALVKLVISKLPVHEAATAYRPRLSLLANVTPHAGGGPILKMDLKEFFPSIRSDDWSSYCRKTGCLSDPLDVYLTSRLLFYRSKHGSILRLAIGAPSSPALSNVLMYEFDEKVSASIAESARGFVTYTRYADDLTFSAPRTGYLNGVVSNVARVIRELPFPKLDINGEKTTEVTRKYHRSVTGLTLSNDGKVTLGRSRKREISAQVHRAIKGGMDRSELASLAGTLAFVYSVEPSFLEALFEKYGAEAVLAIKHRRT